MEDRYLFEIIGSTGNEYLIVLELRDGLAMTCNCPAGQNRMICKHIKGLLGYGALNLKYEQPADLEDIKILFKDTIIAETTKEIYEIECKTAELQKEKKKQVAKLSRILYAR